MTTSSQMSNVTAGTTNTVMSTASTYSGGTDDINNNLILSAWICQLVEEEEDFYFNTLIHSITAMQRLCQHHYPHNKEGPQRTRRKRSHHMKKQ
jgi:hypothetical protein